MARTAVVAGTATAVSGGVQRRSTSRQQQAAESAAYQQAQQQAALDAQVQAAAQQAAAQQAAPAAPPSAPADDPLAKLKELAELKAAGVLSDDEFAVMKAKILAG